MAYEAEMRVLDRSSTDGARYERILFAPTFLDEPMRQNSSQQTAAAVDLPDSFPDHAPPPIGTVGPYAFGCPTSFTAKQIDVDGT